MPGLGGIGCRVSFMADTVGDTRSRGVHFGVVSEEISEWKRAIYQGLLRPWLRLSEKYFGDGNGGRCRGAGRPRCDLLAGTEQQVGGFSHALADSQGA